MKYHALCILYRLLSALMGYHVYAYRLSEVGHRTRLIAHHRAMSFADALAWAACYGTDYRICIARHSRVLSERLPARPYCA